MTTDPVLIAYSAKRSRDRKKTYWNRIGEAYPHDSGAGLTVVLDVLPLDGRIILLEPDLSDDRRLAGEARSKTRRSKDSGKPKKA